MAVIKKFIHPASGRDAADFLTCLGDCLLFVFTALVNRWLWWGDHATRHRKQVTSHAEQSAARPANKWHAGIGSEPQAGPCRKRLVGGGAFWCATLSRPPPGEPVFLPTSGEPLSLRPPSGEPLFVAVGGQYHLKSPFISQEENYTMFALKIFIVRTSRRAPAESLEIPTTF